MRMSNLGNWKSSVVNYTETDEIKLYRKRYRYTRQKTKEWKIYQICKRKKAPGEDGIVGETMKIGDPALINNFKMLWLHTTKYLSERTIPWQLYSTKLSIDHENYNHVKSNSKATEEEVKNSWAGHIARMNDA